MTIDNIFTLAKRAGIQKGMDGAWIALEDELIDFAQMIEQLVKAEAPRTTDHEPK